MAAGRPRRVILDVDVGIDDYLTLLIFLHAEKLNEVKIEAIVCTMGNTSLDNVCTNVVRLLETVGRTDIPVYRGAFHQLIPVGHLHGRVHGEDGMGDLEYSSSPDLSVMRREPAALGTAGLLAGSPHDITLVCVGPLTNLALAIRLYKDMADSIKDLWIMGGNCRAVGNASMTAEFNFSVDPEAAHIVLDGVKKPIFVLPWETCLLPNIPKDWQMETFAAKDHPAFDLLVEAMKSIYAKNGTILKMCDAFLAAAFLYPDAIITKKSCFHATVELHGSLTRGQVVLDHERSRHENVTMIEDIDREAFKELLQRLQL